MSTPANESYHRYNARCWARPRTDEEVRAEAAEREAVRGDVGAWTRAEELRHVLEERAAGVYCAACGYGTAHAEHRGRCAGEG